MCFAGRRSYHVYLAQMLYFFIACGSFAALAKRLTSSHKLLTGGGIDITIGILSFPLSLFLGLCLFRIGGIAEKMLLGSKVSGGK